MKISDFFKKNKNYKIEKLENNNNDDDVKDNEINKLQNKIKDLKYQLESVKKTQNYKTGEDLKNIQIKLNNKDINSFEYSCNNIQIKNNKVYIDGIEQTDITNCKNKYIYLKLNSPCDIEATNVDKLTINGDINNIDITNGDVICNNIKGDIDITNGNIYKNY